MVADLTLVMVLTLPVIGLGFALGVRFETGVAGVLVFMAIAGLWGLAFTGFPYAIALKTGNPAAVNSSFLLFFPFSFLTTAFLPRESLTGWLATVARYNPVTYLLDGLRSIVSSGWDGARIGKAPPCDRWGRGGELHAGIDRFAGPGAARLRPVPIQPTGSM
jgi:ABC-2 type transport system permease protein